jgi:raffinose/stachyose/melibiose transport system substrate-binding protein
VGKQIRDLYKEGYDAVGTGNNYPYVLVSLVELEDEKTYQVAISGISEKLASILELPRTWNS